MELLPSPPPSLALFSDENGEFVIGLRQELRIRCKFSPPPYVTQPPPYVTHPPPYVAHPPPYVAQPPPSPGSYRSYTGVQHPPTIQVNDPGVLSNAAKYFAEMGCELPRDRVWSYLNHATKKCGSTPCVGAHGFHDSQGEASFTTQQKQSSRDRYQKNVPPQKMS